MPKYVALSREAHQNARWKRFSSYGFAANDAFLPLLAAELARAAVNMPVAFVERDGAPMLVAVTSLTPGVNLFVSQEGQWLGGYVPAALRSYPFRLLPVKERNESVLVLDEDSGLIGEGEAFADAEPVFNADGTPARPVADTLEFLKQCEVNRQISERAVAALAEADLLEDWPITVKTDQGERQVAGLRRVSETKLNALDDAAFLKLRHAAALPLVYTHLISMQNMANFDKIVRLREQLAAARAAQSAAPAWQIGGDDELLF
jgi:hypothetical protein